MSDDLRRAERAYSESVANLSGAQERRLAAERERDTAWRTLAELRRGNKGPIDPATCPIDALREHIADAARDHGGDCATLGRIPADPSEAWTRFRRLLAALARRAS